MQPVTACQTHITHTCIHIFNTLFLCHVLVSAFSHHVDETRSQARSPDSLFRLDDEGFSIARFAADSLRIRRRASGFGCVWSFCLGNLLLGFRGKGSRPSWGTPILKQRRFQRGEASSQSAKWFLSAIGSSVAMVLAGRDGIRPLARKPTCRAAGSGRLGLDSLRSTWFALSGRHESRMWVRFF